ncbi:MAG: lipoyl(octanoyl) transferase LipB [Chloroflexota bacterium]|nr:lipoyl(octanoyl) transferase LipB [Chloroflexota bacterium]MDE3102674.1 lipoyl(octanoyl) transferase LipB [Chloroflexota bacterium]
MERSGELRATWLGRVPYLDGWRLQEAVATRVRSGGPSRLLLLEHDPVYTIGRRGTTANLLAAPAELRAHGASVYRVDRGGDITFHGPGQLVGYPIVGLGEAPDLVGYVRALEGAIIEALASYGIAGRRIEHKTGVWVDLRDGRAGKICAIGVRVSRGVSTHGFALNVSTDLAAFTRMLPCGFAHEAASFERLGLRADLREAGERVAATLARRLGLELRTEDGVDPARDDEVPADAPVRSAEDLLATAAA